MMKRAFLNVGQGIRRHIVCVAENVTGVDGLKSLPQFFFVTSRSCLLTAVMTMVLEKSARTDEGKYDARCLLFEICTCASTYSTYPERFYCMIFVFASSVVEDALHFHFMYQLFF
jgi:hypothetical protein